MIRHYWSPWHLGWGLLLFCSDHYTICSKPLLPMLMVQLVAPLTHSYQFPTKFSTPHCPMLSIWLTEPTIHTPPHFSQKHCHLYWVASSMCHSLPNRPQVLVTCLQFGDIITCKLRMIWWEAWHNWVDFVWHQMLLPMYSEHTGSLTICLHCHAIPQPYIQLWSHNCSIHLATCPSGSLNFCSHSSALWSVQTVDCHSSR